ncbi:hypothetical protein [Corynebacterium renale]|uniref:HNH endonuclease n=1 Tax=Corynebacterium renale TaxID=1724 RepID=A0A2A9DN80_9CORY|nr:hypothetical protein [Corynebacterium renale]PFG27412.1 hypothetical protein ATK06_0470 [Corynebacterium renale]SQI23464.1 Uncharacterised protein [Corynebacterium renale]
MAWLRVGDNIVTHPLMSRLLEACEYDHALKNEAFGLFISMATVSAAHLTDYVVEPGLVGQFAPGHETRLLDVLREAGLVKNHKDEATSRWLYALENDEEFVHMRSKAEVELDRDRQRDRRNPELSIPVRVRDGDQCRWCGKTLNFNDHKSARGGTIDSLNGHEESTVDTLVVSCRACNSARKDGEGKNFVLRPVPTDPWYRPQTIKWINNHEWSQANGVSITPAQQELPIDKDEKEEQPREVDPYEGAPEWAKPNEAERAEMARLADEMPDWMTSDPRSGGAQPGSAADPLGGGAQPGSAADPLGGGAQPGSAADPHAEDASALEKNPNGYPLDITGSQGDEPGLYGSGRVGSDLVGPGRKGKRRRRRGRRGTK